MSWQDNAACSTADHRLFFPVGRSSSDAEAAIAICDGCPAKQDCLDFALTTNQEHGVWGGMNEIERKRYKRRLQRRNYNDALSPPLHDR